jgi:hypothetical protein
VDTFAGTITATTPVVEVERLEERHGPAWLSILGTFCRQFAWWTLAIGLFLVLETCSRIFFAGLDTLNQPQPLYIIGLSLLGAFLFFLTLEIVIAHTTIRWQKPLRRFVLV